MSKIVALVVFACCIISGCSDNNGCKMVKPEAEEPQITAFAAANGISATRHASGMYYQVINPGYGLTPNYNSTVYITYVGKRMDGSVFDQSATTVSMPLRNLIEGWQVGLPLIKKGGSIKLIVPSSMAYGCAGYPPSIPPNSVLYFDIQLIDVQ